MKFIKYCLLFIFQSSIVLAGSFEIGQSFIQLESGEIRLANKSYISDSGVMINLLAAMHFAKKEFYVEQEQALNQADKVLFEGKGLDEEGRLFFETELGQKSTLLSDQHKVCANAFGLACQKASIDYSDSRFIHADISFQELKNNGVLKEIESNVRKIEQNHKDKPNPCQYVFNSAVESQRSIGLKAYLEPFLTMPTLNEEELRKAINNEDFYKYEFDHRNKIVLQKLHELLQENNFAPKNFVIFYGAAHMPVFERELLLLGFKPLKQEWLSAISY